MEPTSLLPRSECRHEAIRVYNSPLMKLKIFNIKRIVLELIWLLLHLLAGIVHLGTRITQCLESYIISITQPDKYKNLRLEKLRCLAVVVDSDEALSVSKVVDLLGWLSAIGIQHVSLYDAQGALKKKKEMFLKNVHSIREWEGTDQRDASNGKMTLEVLSISDGKEAAAKAATFLYTQHLQCKCCSSIDMKDPTFSEVDMNRAFKAVGCWGPEPDLLLIFGEARCHVGFPPWRLRYTELVYMGTLRSMKYGAILKAIYDFTKVQQNYGS